MSEINPEKFFVLREGKKVWAKKVLLFKRKTKSPENPIRLRVHQCFQISTDTSWKNFFLAELGRIEGNLTEAFD